MKYKYEFKMDENFEKGCCYSCPLGYIDYDDDIEDYDDNFDTHCFLHARWDECPLEEVKD